MELDEIKQRLAAVEGELKRWGLDLGESFGNLDRAPSATCVQAGVVIEQMLRDLWKRLKLKGSPDRKQFEDLLTLTSKKLEEDGAPIPIEVLTDIRDIQARRNQAAHHWNVNRRVASGILGSLADVMTWYFVTFLPPREDGPSQGKEGNPPEPAVIPKREATRAPEPEPDDAPRLDSDRGPEKTPHPEAGPTEIRPADLAPLPTEAPSLRSLVTAPAVVGARSRLRRFGLVALASALVLLACLLVVPGLLPAPAASPVWTSQSTGMTFALIPAGDFVMGSAEGDDDEKPPHPVTISKPFYLGVHEVTQAEYQAVMGTNPSYFSAGGGGKDNVAGQSTDRHPVEQVSWKDAIAFCNALSVRDGLTPYYRSDEGEPLGGDGYRLPTEAEWEYACRARSTTQYSFGDEEARLGEYAWYDGNSDHRTHPVGQKQPNTFGLFDMHGNVWEWCWDGYDKDYYSRSSNLDPINARPATVRVLRGGSWIIYAAILRSSNRIRYEPTNRNRNGGFRPARTYR
jgi:formylglycine-generating enzyme required for sulfatase activity